MKTKEQAKKAAKWWADKAREKSTNEKENKKIDDFEETLCNLIFQEQLLSSRYEIMLVSDNEPEGFLAMAALISFVDYSMLPSRISMKITEKDIKVKDSNKSMYERVYKSI